jgi:hypothetical protein
VIFVIKIVGYASYKIEELPYLTESPGASGNNDHESARTIN